MQQTGDVSSMIVAYNFVVSVLLMLASPQIAEFAGYASRVHRTKLIRFTKVSTFTIGAVWAALSGSVYVLVHMLNFGV